MHTDANAEASEWSDRRWGIELVKVLTPRRLGYAYATLANTVLGPTWHIGYFRAGRREQVDVAVLPGLPPRSAEMLSYVAACLPDPQDTP